MFDFNFSEKGLGLASPPHLVYMIFQEKCSSCYRPNLSVLLPLLLKIL